MTYQKVTTSLVLAITMAGLGISQAVTYTWTNGIGDGDWTNAGNWDANGVPVDNNGDNGLSLHRSNDSIVFSATTMPSANIPGIGGRNGTNIDTPTLVFDSGGTISLNAGVGGIGGLISNQVNLTRTVFTVGDGIGGAGGDVTLNLSLTGALIRHDQGVTHNFLVNSDGTLNFTGNLSMSSEPGAPRPRYSTLTINNGAINVNGTINNLDDSANNQIIFNGNVGSFTAAYGADLPAYSDVVDSLNVDFLSGGGIQLHAFDNGNGTFTVATPEPSRAVILLAGFGLLLTRRSRR